MRKESVLLKTPNFYFIPIQRPSFACRPLRVSGIPVALEILRFSAVIPKARFHENVIPGPSFILPPLGP